MNDCLLAELSRAVKDISKAGLSPSQQLELQVAIQSALKGVQCNGTADTKVQMLC